MKLLIQALLKFLFGILLVFAILFLPAGTLHFPNGWLFLGLLFIPMALLGVCLFIFAPSLLKKRINAKEKEGTQKRVVATSGVLFLLGFITAGLDFRFSWSKMPTFIVIFASFILLISYALYAEVMRENAYLSRTVKVQEGQKVIDTGLYSVVRHPMYLATLLMFLPIPLILCSLWGLIPFALYPVIIVIRIINEEKVLENGLDGYTEYKSSVKYRLIPFIW